MLFRNITNVLNFINARGISGCIKTIFYRAVDIFYEWYFRVSTMGRVSVEKLGLDNSESVEYASVSYRHIIEMLNRIPVDKSKSTLLDYGCGKGRVLVIASADRFKRIIGVEISRLISTARENIHGMRHRETEDVVLEQCDAAEYDIPLDVNIIFFFNPFRGSTLKSVVEKIRSSYEKSPRDIFIIFFNNDHFEKAIISHHWLSKIYQSDFHHNISCGLYRTFPYGKN